MNLLRILKQKCPPVFELTPASVQKGGIVTFLNPVSFVKVYQLKADLTTFDYVLVDGILLLKTLAWTSVLKSKRYSLDMTSLGKDVFEFSEKNGTRLYFIGSSQENIENFVHTIKTNYKVNIVGYRNGYFKDEGDRAESIESIVKADPGIVLVGMGTPAQEDFLADLKTRGFKGLGFSCGGFIHQTTKRLKNYPDWVDKMHLRMPYRLFTEQNLYKRLPLYPLFLYYYLKELVKYHASRSHHPG